MDIPNGATARNGSVAATLNIWIRLISCYFIRSDICNLFLVLRHLKQAVETASKEKEKVENIFGVWTCSTGL